VGGRKRIIVVANRLPIQRGRREGETRWVTSPGGLVSALTPILQKADGHWVGWHGTSGRARIPTEHDGINLTSVELSPDEVEGFYHGFSNRTIWPLYHDAVRPPEFHRSWWWVYVEANRRFAEAVAEVASPTDLIWVQDYHLHLVPAFLREILPRAKIGFFLHIPFPPTELFAQLPWRRQLLEGTLGADLVGFQTRYGGQNFSRTARRYADAKGTTSVLEWDSRKVEVEPFPISIDSHRFAELANRPDIQAKAKKIREQFGGERKMILGVDRLDYTKGIDIRLRAFQTVLERSKSAADRFVFVQVAVPSRERVPEYEALRTRIEQLVGHINGTWGEPDRIPVHYLYRSLGQEQLAAYYLAADIMCVTPFRDGMNLVAKEYVAMRNDRSGALVLSEFAGAAAELRGAILVNPHDIDGLARALEYAVELSDTELRRRMAAMRRIIRKHDVYVWANNFIRHLST